jgi:hypothetical protein
MVKHIVLFKLTTFSDEEDKMSQLRKMKEIFSVLPEKLGYITEYRTGINFTVAEHAWDFVIDSIFRGREELEQYQVSDVHREAIRKASSIGKTKAVVDYEF